jgi:hypothetical protein
MQPVMTKCYTYICVVPLGQTVLAVRHNIMRRYKGRGGKAPDTQTSTLIGGESTGLVNPQK